MPGLPVLSSIKQSSPQRPKGKPGDADRSTPFRIFNPVDIFQRGCATQGKFPRNSWQGRLLSSFSVSWRLGGEKFGLILNWGDRHVDVLCCFLVISGDGSHWKRAGVFEHPQGGRSTQAVEDRYPRAMHCIVGFDLFPLLRKNLAFDHESLGAVT